MNGGAHPSHSFHPRRWQLRGGGGDDTPKNNPAVVDGFALISDTVLYEKWRKLVSRKVRMPSGRIVNFEVVGQSSGRSKNDENDAITDQAVLIFAWNRSTQTATLIREYMPALHCKMFGLAAGMVETDKHGNKTAVNDDDMAWTAARHELEEECLLIGGEWIRLTESPVTMDKYSSTALSVYLVLDPVPVVVPHRPRDETEEGMEVVRGVTVQELLQKIRAAEMTVVGSWASLLALRKLQEMGETQ